MSDTPIRTMGGFADARDHRHEALNSRTYGRALLAEARADPRIVCLGADLSQPTETFLFRDELPDRFFMMGIQEANMVGAAAGMARCGDVAFAHSFCVFITRRVYDQVAMQVAYPRLPVKLAGFIPGLTTPLGVSHQATDDIALMRALPNMTVIEPSGPEQVAAARPDETTPLQTFEIGRGHVLRHGEDVALLACGMMVEASLAAAARLADHGLSVTVANMASLKPYDTDLAVSLVRRHRIVVTAENHSVIGGLGSMTAEALMLGGATPRFGMVGVQDVFAEGATTEYLAEQYCLTPNHIVQKVLSLHTL